MRMISCQMSKLINALKGVCLSSIVQTIPIIKNSLHSLAMHQMSFPTSATLGLQPIVACCGNGFWEGAV